MRAFELRKATYVRQVIGRCLAMILPPAVGALAGGLEGFALGFGAVWLFAVVVTSDAGEIIARLVGMLLWWLFTVWLGVTLLRCIGIL